MLLVLLFIIPFPWTIWPSSSNEVHITIRFSVPLQFQIYKLYVIKTIDELTEMFFKPTEYKKHNTKSSYLDSACSSFSSNVSYMKKLSENILSIKSLKIMPSKDMINILWKAFKT